MTGANKNLAILARAFVLGLSILSLMGCAAAVSAVSTVGSGIAMGAEQLVTEPVTKTLTHNFDQIKKAVLVALCRMEISVKSAREIKSGEEILAKAENLDVEIELKEITPSVTRIKIKASNGFLKTDNATAQEIVQQTTQIAKKLRTWQTIFNYPARRSNGTYLSALHASINDNQCTFTFAAA